jgi:enolase-phosphatase E1
VSIRLAARGVTAVLLDIEGTTTPIAFVHDVLFPFARARLDAWLTAAAGTPDFMAIAAQLDAEYRVDRASGAPVPDWPADAGAGPVASIAAYASWLMDRDRKSPGLKRLQGLIWEEGYQAGTLRGEVFPDVSRALQRWRAQGIDVAIYSSGSALAQRRLFESTPDGDLTSHLCGFFDTSVGAKRDPASYRRVAEALNRPPRHILFISDVQAELEAAEAAGLQAVLSVRPGNAPVARASFVAIRSFDEVA